MFSELRRNFALKCTYVVLKFATSTSNLYYYLSFARFGTLIIVLLILFPMQIFASFFSSLIYAWMDPLLWKGFRRPLEQSSLWQLHPRFTSRGVVPTFDHYYAKSIQDAKKKGNII